MQRTRLNTLVTQSTARLQQWVFNPWRRLAVLVIALLFGNFFATAISATAGQAAKLDVTISAILVILVEIISWIYYRGKRPAARLSRMLEVDTMGRTEDGSVAEFEQLPTRSRSTFVESLNAFKLGMIYGLFVEAFKLGS